LCTLCVSSLSSTCSLFCYLTTRRPPTSPLFPYTTLFRSVSQARHQHAGRPARRAHRARARDRVRRTARRRGVRRLLSRRGPPVRSEEHTSELQSRENLVCRLLLEKKKQTNTHITRTPGET